ncbi:hypothetical protein BTO05_07975 [Winogradskyella sp. PC-19]|uniref:hypothetical protein n=1 Tax=unclassified Winogradskyella TaxID=2615021 RepID=UPI000B3CE546|nr:MULTISPECIES: hypothetical protein [unclassified Winogradskyella]ARV09579.1 hypothetical protein BTO05_07975 [Winogradskyella sp. PC-19]RZN83433.1 MAG: hypothetical protein EVB12_01615 [Winogradskyella sp.]
MKKITIALVMLISVMSFAQGNAELKAHYEAYYKQMKNQGDVQGVINAMTHLDILTPSQARRDTLAYLYVSEGKYIQALNTIGIEKNATDSDLNTEVKAISFKNLNDVKRALEHYNVLFDRNPNPSLAYEIADLMMQNNEDVAAKSKIEYGLQNVTDDMKRAFYETQRPYETSLKAALLYLKALNLFKENQTANLDASLKLVNDALAIDPNFNMAKRTREALEAKKAQPKN